MNKLMWPLLSKYKILPDTLGKFGTIRKYDIHTGIDLYCPDNTQVLAIEDSEVIHIDWFTGVNANPSTPFWNNTKALVLRGKYTIVYGEIESFLQPGMKIKAGETIGYTKKVLNKDKGRPMSMLHLEKYSNHWKPEHGFIEWKLGTKKPKYLLNPNKLLDKHNITFDLVSYQLALIERELI